MADHPSEAGRWYTRDGQEMHEVPRAKGDGMRPTTLRDARKLDLVPSVTTIIRECARPGLERWIIDQAILAAVTMPRIEGEADADWLKRVHADRQEQARSAAEQGKATHARIQECFAAEDFDPPADLLPITSAVLDAAQWIPVPEHPFSHPFGFGGKVDLHVRPDSPSEHHGWVGDLKGKETPELVESAVIYDEHLMQLAAYRVGLRMDWARAGIVFYSRTEPHARYVEADQDDLARGWRMFEALHDYWIARTGYRPSFEEVTR